MTIVLTSEPTRNVRIHPVPNRRNQSPVFGSTVGIDTIRVTYPVRAETLAYRSEHARLDHRTGEYTPLHTTASLRLPVAGLRVHTSDRWQQRCWFEFSVPRLLRQENASAASLGEMHRAIRRIYLEASEYIDFGCDWTDYVLRRVDIVRDFRHVPDLAHLLDGLSKTHLASAVRHRFADPERGHAQSLVVGTKGQWQVTAYDKVAEMAAMLQSRRRPLSESRRAAIRAAVDQHAATGLLRVEVSVRQPLARKFDCGRHDQFSMQTAEEIAVHYFNRAGLASNVGGRDRLTQALQAMDADPEVGKRADRVIAVLFREAHGLPQTLGRETLRQVRRSAAEYGLTPADFWGPPSRAQRLDWASGTCVQDES